MKKRVKRTSKKAIIISITIIILILGILYNVLNVPKIILERIYPKQYAQYVYKYSKQNDVDPLLIFAIIKAESNFNPQAVSKSGAIGLMQLMETTAEDTAKKMNIEYSKEQLCDPETNIMIGTTYFSTLLQKYKNITISLTAYNAGSGNVDKWLENGTLQKDGTNAENIPYRETNNYVRKILKDYEIYKRGLTLLRHFCRNWDRS